MNSVYTLTPEGQHVAELEGQLALFDVRDLLANLDASALSATVARMNEGA